MLGLEDGFLFLLGFGNFFKGTLVVKLPGGYINVCSDDPL